MRQYIPLFEENEAEHNDTAVENKLVAFVKANKNLDDSAFHDLAKSLNMDPHEAEEVIYRKLHELLNK